MTKFLDGPAKGQVLMLIRTPVFLRVTEQNGKWDALNLLEDKPLAGEKLHAYLLIGHHGYAMVDGTKFRGRCAIATYAYIDAQPSDDIMRNNDAWAKWVETARTLKEHIDRATFLAPGPSMPKES